MYLLMVWYLGVCLFYICIFFVLGFFVGVLCVFFGGRIGVCVYFVLSIAIFLY